jgi:hypothetical protein
MLDVLRQLALRLAACVAITALSWRLGTGARIGVIGVAGLLLARPLVELGSELWRLARRIGWHDVQGRHYSFRGRMIDVRTDADHWRWVRLADVRAAVGFTASDGALRSTYPTAWSTLGRPPEPYLREDALVTHLAKERNLTAAKFRHWAEREIAFPGRRERERLGPPATPDAPASEPAP